MEDITVAFSVNYGVATEVQTSIFSYKKVTLHSVWGGASLYHENFVRDPSPPSPLPRENRFCIVFPFSLPKTALFKTETKYKLYRRRHGNVFSELDLKSDNLSCHGLDKFTIISTKISRSYISTNSLASQYWGSLASLQCSQNHERSVVKPR